MTTTVPRPTSRPQRHNNAVACAEFLTVDYLLGGDMMIVASASKPGKLYTITVHKCSHETGRRKLLCKHAAYHIASAHALP